jgi:hypothetical protein
VSGGVAEEEATTAEVEKRRPAAVLADATGVASEAIPASRESKKRTTTSERGEGKEQLESERERLRRLPVPSNLSRRTQGNICSFVPILALLQRSQPLYTVTELLKHSSRVST